MAEPPTVNKAHLRAWACCDLTQFEGNPRNPRPRAATARELLRVCREVQGRFREVEAPLLIVHGEEDRDDGWRRGERPRSCCRGPRAATAQELLQRAEGGDGAGAAVGVQGGAGAVRLSTAPLLIVHGEEDRGDGQRRGERRRSCCGGPRAAMAQELLRVCREVQGRFGEVQGRFDSRRRHC